MAWFWTTLLVLTTASSEPARTEPEVLAELHSRFIRCLDTGQLCERDFVGWVSPEQRIFDWLETRGTPAAAPLLLQLIGRGVFEAQAVLEHILTRDMVGHLGLCPPLTPHEVSAQAKTLDDFAVVEQVGGRLAARPLATAEREDLAYFLAAVAQAGPAMGTLAQEALAQRPAQPGAPARRREHLEAELRQAWLKGDAAAIYQRAGEYLAALGFPGPLRERGEGPGVLGPRATDLLHERALAAELLGRFKEAEALYRRAGEVRAPGGTDTPDPWHARVRGAIRAAERTGQCRRALAERLLHSAAPSEPYGPQRLAASGFDLARLHRGALLTGNREVDAGELRAALAGSTQGAAAAARLAARGPEAWESRVLAVEGLADVQQRAAMPVLQAVARSAAPPLRARALLALGRLARRPARDPCLSDLVDDEPTGSSGPGRPIAPLGRLCATQLVPGEAREIAQQLERFTEESIPAVRLAAVQALGEVASPSSRLLLQRLLGSAEVAGEQCDTDVWGRRDGCRPFYPVRTAAREALRRLDRLEAGRERF